MTEEQRTVVKTFNQKYNELMELQQKLLDVDGEKPNFDFIVNALKSQIDEIGELTKQFTDEMSDYYKTIMKVHP